MLFFQERMGGGSSSCDEEAAHEAFAYFDRNGDGAISCAELQESALEMLAERKHIAASIKVGGAGQ
jgi:Ca2+-binding EF-hand superfamily protein